MSTCWTWNHWDLDRLFPKISRDTYAVTLLNQRPIFPWYIARLVVKNGKNMSYNVF